jgi:hypothetical protein
MKLLPGQARGDQKLISEEMNKRGQFGDLSDAYRQQNTQLIQNAERIREEAAPDVYTTTKVGHADTIIKAYTDLDDALTKEISTKYKALEAANGGDFPLNAKRFVDMANEELHKKLLFEHVPGPVRSTMNTLAEAKKMTFEQFEALRTNLARVQRSAADGNERAAAGVIRQALEDLPLPSGAAQLKPLADEARAAARARFALIERDPAFKAVVNGKARPDNFINNFVVRADRNTVAIMKDTLAHDPVALQTMAAGTLDEMKAAAVGTTGNFSQSAYNKILGELNAREKLRIIFDTDTAKKVETLGRVAGYTQIEPKGGWVNRSNTFVSAAKEMAASGLERSANMLTLGFPSGTLVRGAARAAIEKRAINKVTQTGAGINLKDIKP